MTSSRIAAVGVVLALVFSCGPKPDTALVVTVKWPATNDIFVLEFSGPAAGESTRVPASVPANPLTSDQTARILVAESEAGKMLAVTVSGLNHDLAPAWVGSATSPAIVASKETAMTVTLGPVDAGYCFGPYEASKQAGLYIVGCETNGNACTSCGTGSDRCIAGACSCGTHAACGPGLLCVRDGSGAAICACSTLSNCQGCCNGTTECVPYASQDKTKCATAGNQCERSCNLACTSGACAALDLTCTGARCLSGTKCQNIAFPTCLEAGTKRCMACDVYRSNLCSASGGCVCGPNMQVCTANQLCLPLGPNGAAICASPNP